MTNNKLLTAEETLRKFLGDNTGYSEFDISDCLPAMEAYAKQQQSLVPTDKGEREEVERLKEDLQATAEIGLDYKERYGKAQQTITEQAKRLDFLEKLFKDEFGKPLEQPIDLTKPDSLTKINNDNEH